MYDRLTPLGRNITDAVLPPSADGPATSSPRSCSRPDDPSLITDETVTARSRGRTLTARIRRDAYGVPHVYSDTDDGVMFGAGYVARRGPQPADRPGARQRRSPPRSTSPACAAIELVRGLYTYKPTAKVRAEVTRQQDAALQGRRRRGRARCCTTSTPTSRASTSGTAATAPTRDPSTAATSTRSTRSRPSTSARAAARRSATRCCSTPRATSSAPGAAPGLHGPARTQRPGDADDGGVRAPWQTKVPVAGARGLVRLEQGTFKSRRAEAARPGRGRRAAARREASNVLLVAGEPLGDRHAALRGRPADRLQLPRPDARDGPLRAAHPRPRRDLAPFPGYMLIGRGERLRLDAHLPRGRHRRHLRRAAVRRLAHALPLQGPCRRMETVSAGTIAKGGERVHVKFRRTVHGPVDRLRPRGGHQARRRARAQAVELRPRDGRPDLLPAADVRPRQAARPTSSPRRRRRRRRSTSFYASDSEIAFYTTGRLPLRRKGVNPDLPVDGRGRYEWRGFLPARAIRRSVNPPSGLLVNWNNKPAPDFPASDSRFGQEGPITRVRAAAARARARRPKHTLDERARRRERGAPPATRATLLWPTVSAVLAAGAGAEPARAAAMAAELDRWAADDGGWVDADGDGNDRRRRARR